MKDETGHSILYVYVAHGIKTAAIRVVLTRIAMNIEGAILWVDLAGMTKEQADEIVFTENELGELERTRKMSIALDKDCSETTPEKAV